MPPDVPVGDQRPRSASTTVEPLSAARASVGDSGKPDPVVAAVQDPPTPSDDWVRTCYGQIHRAAWMMTGDAWAADDLAQETFVVAIDKWNKFDGRSTRSTWLYGILIRLHRRHNRTLSRLSRRLKKHGLQTEHQQSEKRNAADPAIVMATRSWQQSVWAAVAQLPQAQREAITLRYAQELTYEEIATAINVPSGTIKTRVHHGLKRLKQLQTIGNEFSESHNDIEPPSST
ncbi:RNA polymerase sigma factor [Planctomycetes bacterium K23_9]|uniref:RNA polymerase sigma factor n=1 Tax=Stieleria marina TaxID=1930275 RepID=A0A517NZE8_9BACT|nr:ECF RNA polymerase sigma factor SigW [Planctomycetes bacterium K23_9]